MKRQPRTPAAAPEAKPPSRSREALLLALVLAAGSAIIRAQHLDWGLPDLEEEAFPLKKAFEMCGWGTGRLRLDPDTAGWPSLSFYVHMLLQHLHYAAGRLTGAFADRQDYFLQQLTWTPLAVLARGVGVAASGVVVYVGARLGSRLAGPGGGLLAGGILAASPLLTQHAQLITPDILLVMFAALALGRLVDVGDRGRRRDYLWAGVWIGLGISAKYTPALLLPALLVAHALRVRREGGSLRRAGLDRRGLWLAAGAGAAAFLATSPFLPFDLNVLARDVDYQVAHLGGGHFGHENQRPGLLFYALDVLGPGLGWPAFGLGLAGLAVAARRRGGAWWVVAAAFVAYYVALALLRTRFDRYMLPALLPLALGVAFWWTMASARLAGRGRAAIATALAVLLLATVVPPGRSTARFLAKQGRPGTLQLAKDWILATTRGQPAALAMELYTPFLPRTKHLWLRRNDPAFPRLNSEQQRRWLALEPVDVVYLPFYTTNTGAGDFYYDLRHFLADDYVVTSSAVRGRFEQTPGRHPRQAAFYGDLERWAPAVAVFAPEGVRRGPEIRIHAVTAETRARLRAERPPITQDDFRRVAGQVVGSHFQDFVKTIAEQAMARGDAAMAATYYQPLYETTPPEQRAAFLPAYAFAVLRAERWAQSEPLLQRWRELAPADPQPAGYLGLARARLGRTAEARGDFTECMELAAGAAEHRELAAWARQQLDALADR